MAPIIGISTYRELARWGVWETAADLLPAGYARRVAAAGGIAVLLPAQQPAYADTVVASLDGLVIAGGADIEPNRYSAVPHPRTVVCRPERDAWELALLEAAAAREVPTLGVCRGLQLMAVRTGGRLHQHLPDLVGHEGHSPGLDQYGTTAVDVVPGSRLSRLVGEHLTVSCHHHQCVVTHPGLAVAARAADGTIEALEDRARPFWLGVQWHPETAEDAGLFRGLVAAAAFPVDLNS